ncbi:MAG: VWA domain-containing protein [Actinophytocola sp.]|nr:VWA domain-containing protein [Actinophytocola sp.]
MTTEPHFTVEIAHNRYLAPGAGEIDAVINVATTETGARLPTAAQVIMLDCSASMYRPSKLAAAKRAASAAIDALRDDTAFAVVAGTDQVAMVYPEAPELAEVDEHTRAAAKEAIDAVQAGGGTAMSQWLQLAGELLASSRREVRHAILLTDGRNTSEPHADLANTLAELRGAFSCDCRGVGTDWEVGELREIADALLGTIDIVAEPEDLAADFRALAENAMRKMVPDVTLRLWTPQHAEVTMLRQVDPTLVDLTGHGTKPQPQLTDYLTGAWEHESRAYHARIALTPAGVGERMLACRIAVLDGDGTNLGAGKVLATWTDDPARYGALDTQVAHYTGQQELAEAIQAGLDARRVGDLDTATGKLGRAVALAEESGHTDASRLLSKIVDIDDSARGQVRLKPTVTAVDEMTLDTRSVVTTRMHRSAG